MSFQVGYIDNDGHPRIRVRVEGTNPDASIEIDAMIDTGFTGFLMLPIAQALPLGLALVGTGSYTLADGSQVTNFLARGNATIRPRAGWNPSRLSLEAVTTDETVEGIIVLGGDDALIGMEFIRSLDKVLVVGKIVMLIDQSAVTNSYKTSPGSEAKS